MNFKKSFESEKLREFFDKNFKYILIGVIILGLVIVSLISWVVIGLFTDSTTKVSNEYVDAFNDVEQKPGKNDGFANAGSSTDLEGRSYGIDVSKWQGVIDWKAVKESGIQFAMIRVGFRAEDGAIYEDERAKYNLQEAYNNGIMIGVYFYSNAINETEAKEEAEWTLNYIQGYGISYPVAYDCEGFKNNTSRMYNLNARQRTDYALKYLDMINAAGYDAMLYGSRNDLGDPGCWDIERIDSKYKIWVAMYSKITYPVQDMPNYDRKMNAWQFSDKGKISGIETDVALSVFYFKKSRSIPKNPEATPEGVIDYLTDGTDLYTPVNEMVTAKYYTNLRDKASLSSEIVVVLENGKYVKRIGIGSGDWSMLELDGRVVFAFSSYLIKEEEPNEDYVDLGGGYYQVNENVTAKTSINMFTAPSLDGSEYVATIKNGEIVKRIGKNDLTGWSMLEYGGETVYADSSYLLLVETTEQ